MATWRWADLSARAKPPAPVAAGDPFAYGVPVCDEGGPTDFDTGGCPILIARVVYRGVDYHIHELSLEGQWQCNDLFSVTREGAGFVGEGGNAAFAADDPIGYVTQWNGNSVATVVYVSDSGEINQLGLGGNGWVYNNLSNNDGKTPSIMPAFGRAFEYWDSYNNVDRIVFRALLNDAEIYELSDNTGSWVCANLSTNDKSEPPAQPTAGSPFGYCYGGVPRVIYRGTDNHIYELHTEAAGWRCNDLTKVSGGAPQAASDPYAYVAGVARMIYTDINGHIIELALEASGWKCNNLSTNDKSAKPAPAAAGKPFGYVTFDGIPRVIYRGTDGHIYELHSDKATNFFWKLGDLSAIANATSAAEAAAGDPFGYEIGDSIPRVVYRGTNGHICELALY